MAALILSCLALSGLAMGQTGRWMQALQIEAPKERQPAPAFALPNLAGEKRRLETYKGNLIILNFWATWCQPCRAEMPALEALWREYRDRGLTVIGVNVDRGGAGSVRTMAESLGITFPVLLDPDGKVRNRYRVFAFPQTYLIGRDGKFLGRALGERKWDSEAGHQLIRHLLGKDSANRALKNALSSTAGRRRIEN